MLLFQRLSKNQQKQTKLLAYFSQLKSSTKKKTYYQVLQVPSSASQASIRKNYLKLAKVYHPDVYKGTDKERFQNIQQAYKVLNNVSQRRKYDQSIGRRRPNDSQDYQFKGEAFKDAEKPKNDFDYNEQISKPKQQVNIDQQYEKFFKKSPKTHFEEIRMHEDPQFKKMTVEERVRRTMSQVYRDSNKGAYEKSFQKTYSQILDDHIKQKNDMFQEEKAKQEQIAKRFSPKNVLKQRYLFYAAAIISAYLFYPFAYQLAQKIILGRQQQKMAIQAFERAQQRVQVDKVRQRMVF